MLFFFVYCISSALSIVAIVSENSVFECIALAVSLLSMMYVLLMDLFYHKPKMLGGF